MKLEIIKICGLRRAEDVRVAAEAGATAVGMIFYPASPRSINLEEAAIVAAATPPEMIRVGVFVNENEDVIRHAAEIARLDVLQLHGDEPPVLADALADFRVWKAFRVGEDFSFDRLKEFPCEAFLLDAPAAGAWGGTGATFDWQEALAAARRYEVVLSGGLSADNVGKAIQQVRPWGVDASSRLESEPGVKDPARVRAFVEAAKKAAAGSPE